MSQIILGLNLFSTWQLHHNLARPKPQYATLPQLVSHDRLIQAASQSVHILIVLQTHLQLRDVSNVVPARIAEVPDDIPLIGAGIQTPAVLVLVSVRRKSAPP